jgi:hypothetical protein
MFFLLAKPFYEYFEADEGAAQGKSKKKVWEENYQALELTQARRPSKQEARQLKAKPKRRYII